VTDVFEEVEEQLRSDRYRQLARRALPWVLGLAAVALIATLAYWGWDYYRSQTVAKASEQYAAAVEAIQAGDTAKAKTLWTEASKSSAGGYKALSLMHLGALELEQNKVKEAVALWDRAAEAAPDPLIGDAARLKSAFALLDTAPYAELEGRLKPMTEEGRPYRTQAREALAFAKLAAGNLTGARSDFLVLSQVLDAGESTRFRAQAALGVIDSGSAKAAPAIAKAAATMLPPMVIPPGAVVGGPEGAPAEPQAAAPQ
jgi:hypothetical protein